MYRQVCMCVYIYIFVHIDGCVYVCMSIDVCVYIYIYIYIYIYREREREREIQGAHNKFPDFFHLCTFIDSTHMKLVPFEVISSSCNALVVPFQQLLEGPMEVLLWERVNDLLHSLFHLLNCLIMIASKFFRDLRE